MQDVLGFGIFSNPERTCSMKRKFQKINILYINEQNYCPLPGLQSAKPNASISRKLALAISMTLRRGT
ncbi:hypothetical protein NUACC26_022550 [Scytonema sp. NUACC26]